LAANLGPNHRVEEDVDMRIGGGALALIIIIILLIWLL
jgi:hypothetical protein